ncbi:MAG TPA: 3-hydroxyisobutyrate dehydrogenase [Caulobacteraceae bacterium]|jgi:3-hydroxyisobutyrate dehydrogenase|nr:3-hydroxyisobutyrate dehydrogenase [Caulobacteraceae bacterium]
MTSIAFIGLGAMGSGMAANLAKAGRRVVAFDLSNAALEKAARAGCLTASSAEAAAEDADIIVTMLPAASHVRAVWSSLVPTARADAVVIDCSTIDVETAREVAALATSRGVAAADAPVSGGIMAADAGTLAFMVGCKEADFERVAAALAPMAKTVVHAGGPGAGQAAKICNNMLLGISMLGVCEAFALAEKLGLSPEKFFEIASSSSGQCWSMSTYCPWPGPVPTAPSNRNYEGGFLTRLMSKDLKLAQDAAAKAGAATPMGAQAQALYALFEGLGYGQKDFSAVLQMMRGRLGEL